MRPFQAIGSLIEIWRLLEGEFEVVRLKVFEDLIFLNLDHLQKGGLFDESKEKFVDPLR